MVSPVGCRKDANVTFIIFQGEFVGLIPLITKFLDKTGVDAAARVKIDKILRFISGKASGKPVSCGLLTVTQLISSDRLWIQWNPSIADTIGTNNFVVYSEVSLTQGLPVYFR